jgi:hypothetical protein
MNVSHGKNAGGWRGAPWEEPSAPPSTTYYIRGVKVIRKGDEVLLIRGLIACAHIEPHVHYYVTRNKTDDELSKLIDWLENGFWWDSFGRSVSVIERQFLNNKCMGNVHFL